MTARVLPWIELLAGLFLVLGLWLEIALSVIWLMLLTFILIVAQAIWRNLPLSDCGCFSELFSFPLPVILLLDSSMLILVSLLRRFKEKTSRLSLDRFFLKQK